MVETGCQTVFRIQIRVVEFPRIHFFTILYTYKTLMMMIAFQVISVGTFATADSSFAIANQYKYRYSCSYNGNLAILTSDSESLKHLKLGGI